MSGARKGRRWPVALVLGLYWFCLTASASTRPAAAGPPSAPAAPVRCLGTILYARANTLRLTGWPKLIVSVDVTRADRCAGRFGQPVGRLHGFLVLSRERLALRTHLRTSQTSFWLDLCRWLWPECLDINTALEWPRAADSP